jgi:hypothetical protein
MARSSADATPQRPPEATALPEQSGPEPTAPPGQPVARRPVRDRLGTNPVLAAAAVVIAAGGAFGVGYAVGHASNDDWPGRIPVRDLADRPPGMPQLPGGRELPRLHERDAPRDGDGPGWRDRSGGGRDSDTDRSGSTDSSAP